MFTRYMRAIGMSEEQAVSEVFGFTEDLLSFINPPVIGVFINAQRLNKVADKQKGSVENEVPFYMKQT